MMTKEVIKEMVRVLHPVIKKAGCKLVGSAKYIDKLDKVNDIDINCKDVYSCEKIVKYLVDRGYIIGVEKYFMRRMKKPCSPPIDIICKRDFSFDSNIRFLLKRGDKKSLTIAKLMIEEKINEMTK